MDIFYRKSAKIKVLLFDIRSKFFNIFLNPNKDYYSYKKLFIGIYKRKR